MHAPPNNLSFAQECARRGLSVFPCGADKKAKVKWRTASTTDLDQIATWWRQRPAALPAIDLAKSGHVVIDGDRHGGPDGVAAVEKLFAEHALDAAVVPTIITPGNGKHYWFKQPDGKPLGNSDKAVRADGINVRGHGGYVIAAGASLPDGRRYSRDKQTASLYSALRDNTVPVLPPWLVEILRPAVPKSVGAAPAHRLNGSGGSGVRHRAYAGTALERLCAELAASPEGSRNITLNNAALQMGHMVAPGWIERGVVEQRLHAAAITAGLPHDEIIASLNSGITTGLKEPHAALVDRPLPQQRRVEPQQTAAPADFQSPEWPDLGKGGKPTATCANARAAITALGIECRYDVFHDRKLVGGHAIEQWAGELSDHACHMVRVLIKATYGFDPHKENTHDAAIQLCLQRQFDPVGDYLDSLMWDSKKRLNTWLSKYLGAEENSLNDAIGRLALVAAVRRVRQPGCKFDQIIVLEGPEGTGKSTAIEILAGQENFSDQTIIGLDDRQQQEAVRGVWLFEIADLAGMSKADVDRTKAFASRLSDRARPAYGRQRIELPRRCVFFATTNNETYLKSQTGNRRFWPVKTGRIDLETLRRDRDQLWAEAAHHEMRGASLKLPEEMWAEAAAEQDKRRDHDPWDDILVNVKGTIFDVTDASGVSQEERVSTAELLTQHLKLPADRANDIATKRLSFSMARLGWSKAVIRIDSKQHRGFCRKLSDL